MAMRTIKASEIGSYLFCQRAWWYQREGIDSKNTKELVLGTEMHQKHGQAVAAAGCMRAAAVVFLVAAFVLVVLHFASQVL